MSTPAKKAVPSLTDLFKDDKDKKDNSEVVKDAKNTSEVDTAPEPDKATDVDDDKEKATNENTEKSEPFLSPHVVSTVPNKTPAELSQETPDETADRYNIDQSITEEDAKNPRVQVYDDDYIQQVPSSTHLHPDIAKDYQQRGISERTTDSAQVKRTITDTYDFAPDAETNDKF